MARKGKSAGSRNHTDDEHELLKAKGQARVDKISSLADAGFEGQDAFGLGDDQISLEPGYIARRTLQTQDDDDDLGLDDDEVLALKVSDKRESVAPHRPADSSERPKKRRDNKSKDLAPLAFTGTSRFDADKSSSDARHGISVGEDEDSDAESFTSDSTNDNGQDIRQKVPSAHEDRDGLAWTRSGGYHVSKREIARAEERMMDRHVSEEAELTQQLELAESRRIQRDSKSMLTDSDYGLDQNQKKDLQVIHDTHIASNAVDGQAGRSFPSRELAIEHLLKTEPELLALLDDLPVMVDRLSELRMYVHQLQSDDKASERNLRFATLTRDIVQSYVLNLTFFLFQRSTRAIQTSPQSLLSLTQLREAISTLDDLGLSSISGESDLPMGEVDDDALDEATTFSQQLGRLSRSELEELFSEMGASSVRSVKRPRTSESITDDSVQNSHHSKRRRRTRGPKSKEGSDTSHTSNSPSELLLALHPGSRKAMESQPKLAVDDFIEPAALSTEDSAEKANRKRNLRFYTSQIEAKAGRRAHSSKERYGGDDEVPYRSKERARNNALQRQSADMDIDDGDMLGDSAPASNTYQGDDDADYYDLVAGKRKAHQLDKERSYEEAVAQDRHSLDHSQPLDPNSPRAVNRQIMANKGLTPRRPKSVRNPRVKKRMKYDKAQKKVASIKPVYKGGLGAAAYEGEKSGISSRVVKSRAL